MIVDDIYPLTIVADRYRGVYSGGEYLAFNMRPNDIPTEVWGDDDTCLSFWSAWKNGNSLEQVLINYLDMGVGVGDTIEDAIEDLRSKLRLIERLKGQWK